MTMNSSSPMITNLRDQLRAAYTDHLAAWGTTAQYLTIEIMPDVITAWLEDAEEWHAERDRLLTERAQMIAALGAQDAATYVRRIRSESPQEGAK